MAAPSAVIPFGNNLDLLKLSDLSGATIKLALYTSAASFDASNTGLTEYANTNELATAYGYTQGGVTLSSPTIAAYSTTGFKLTTGNALWTASGGSIPAWRYAVLYVSGSLWGLTNPVLGYFIGDSAPADVPETPDGNGLQLNCPADGWLRIVNG